MIFEIFHTICLGIKKLIELVKHVLLYEYAGRAGHFHLPYSDKPKPYIRTNKVDSMNASVSVSLSPQQLGIYTIFPIPLRLTVNSMYCPLTMGFSCFLDKLYLVAMYTLSSESGNLALHHSPSYISMAL